MLQLLRPSARFIREEAPRGCSGSNGTDRAVQSATHQATAITLQVENRRGRQLLDEHTMDDGVLGRTVLTAAPEGRTGR